MRRLVLTGEEKNVILFIIVTILVGLVVKFYRAKKPRPVSSKPPRITIVTYGLHKVAASQRRPTIVVSDARHPFL